MVVGKALQTLLGRTELLEARALALRHQRSSLYNDLVEAKWELVQALLLVEVSIDRPLTPSRLSRTPHDTPAGPFCLLSNPPSTLRSTHGHSLTHFHTSPLSHGRR